MDCGKHGATLYLTSTHHSICGPAAREKKKEARDSLALPAKGIALCTLIMIARLRSISDNSRSRQRASPLHSLYGWMSDFTTRMIALSVLLPVQSGYRKYYVLNGIGETWRSPIFYPAWRKPASAIVSGCPSPNIPTSTTSATRSVESPASTV